MSHFDDIPRHKESGSSLIEMLTVVVIISILMATATPNILGFWRQNQVNAALDKLHGAIKEAQRQAIRQGRLCRINIDTTNNQLTGNPSNCLFSDRQINENIVIRTNLSGTPPNISFSHKGSTTKSGTIVISSTMTNRQKCFVISLGIGIMRTGNYTGSSTGSVSREGCQSN
ncbi:Type 4 prepilin-like protein [Hyella patelloides LEGE 07179]|uniref:Type 4 prepilin-like protein n=1 Tax=Hyella patelloides LEGE 07179 TaxID=945734 RepID=A0A563VLB6_9CYAN|nr:type II secretion system protein [Hyella patelloides]VEP12123.1 Type 4 prepilin-like protein [Hyella patelloides LEGE 07179]